MRNATETETETETQIIAMCYESVTMNRDAGVKTR